MTSSQKKSVRWVLCAVFLFAVSSSYAQETHALRIQNGQVYIDGRLIPESELPESLETEGVTVNYTFSGVSDPVIRIGEGYFVFDGNGIRAADPDERSRVSVFFRDSDAFDMPDLDLHLQLDELGDIAAAAAPHAAVIQKQAEELRQQAARLGQAFETQHLQELQQVAQQLRAQAQETAQIAQALPRIEVQNYLQSVQKKNQHLYDRLVNEREMEVETLRLADEIRRMAEGELREERIAELRERLDEIFEMKQENRRQEMEQLQERLEDLQEKLEERERLREDVIERRLRQLLRMEEALNW